MIAVASIATGEHRHLFAGSAPQYLPSGHVAYVQAGRLFVVPFDEASSEVRGAPVLTVERLFSWKWTNADAVYYSVSDSGSLAYLAADDVPAYGLGRLVWVDRNGESAAFTEEDDSEYRFPRLSPDGLRVAVSIQSDDGRSLWLYDVERGGSTRFTFEGVQFVSTWNPNGRRLTYGNNRGGFEILSKAIDSTDAAESLFRTDEAIRLGSWSRDGQALAFTRVSGATYGDIWILPAQADAESFSFVSSQFDERAPMFSPDGGYIVYVSDESGSEEVYLRSYPDGTVQRPVSTDGGREPVWARSGREIFYRRGDELRVVDVKLTPELELGRPRTLFEGRYFSGPLGPPNYDVSPDGERFMMIERLDDWPDRIHVVLNWAHELDTIGAQ